jgi:hypothetical protein
MQTPDPNRPSPAAKKIVLALNKRGRVKKRQPSKNPEMGKLKDLWTKTFSDADRAHWRQKFATGETQETKRKDLLEQFGINLDDDRQLNYFRAWDELQEERRQTGERLQANEDHVKQQHPDWTVDQVRDEVIRQAYFEALARADFGLGLTTVRAHTLVKRYLLDRDKYEFDATEKCHERLPELRAIQRDPNLSDEEKMRRIRFQLFGRIAEEQPQPA